MPLITLLTDFGRLDHYVGVMKGVLLQIAPKATLIDISHEIAPQDIVRAAFVLRQTWNWYPPGTVHLAVVDPGVGSSRRILAGKYGGQLVVAPDNGLVSMVHREIRLEAMHVVDNRKYMLSTVSATFHGRDVMAPVAAHLASGVPIQKLGPPTDRLEVLEAATPSVGRDSTIAGKVLCVDHFGNLITNISRQHLLPLVRHPHAAQVYVGSQCVGPLRTAYHEVPAGEPLALIGSSDYLEISINCGHAAEAFAPDGKADVHVR